MTDYKKMYLELVGETNRAVDILISALRKCEEIYIDSSEDEPPAENSDKQ